MKTLKNVGTENSATRPGLQHEKGNQHSGRGWFDGGDPGIGIDTHHLCQPSISAFLHRLGQTEKFSRHREVGFVLDNGLRQRPSAYLKGARSQLFKRCAKAAWQYDYDNVLSFLGVARDVSFPRAYPRREQLFPPEGV